MTPDALRDALDVLAWSQRGLARILGCQEGTVRGWARDSYPVPPDVAAWLAVLADAHRANPAPRRP